MAAFPQRPSRAPGAVVDIYSDRRSDSQQAVTNNFATRPTQSANNNTTFAMKLSRNEKAVVIGVSVIGVGVAASAALIEYLELPKTTPEPKQQKDPLHFEIHIPASKEQFFKSYAEGYSLAKLPLSKIMKFVGQMLVAPIALKALDAVYSAYCDNVNAPQLALEQPTPPKLG